MTRARLGRDGRADRRRHRRPHRTGDTALRLPDSRACARGDRRTAPRAPGPPVRRGGVGREGGALGPLDALVHNAATGVIRPALAAEDKHWDWTHAANARALLSLTRAAAPAMPAGAALCAPPGLGPP